MKDSSIGNAIYESVTSQIMNKQIFPGNRIVEDDLSKEFGVSRSLVRSVMVRLQNEGFVRIVPNIGSCVIKPTAEEMQRAYHTRLCLELGAASLAIHRIKEDALERMEKNYQAQVDLKSTFTSMEYARLNRAFHWEMVSACENEYYIKFLNEMFNIVHIYMVFFDTALDNTVSLRTHRMMLDALKSHDGVKLAEAIRLDQTNGMDNLHSNLSF